MPDQTTDPVVEPIVTPAAPEPEESIFGTPHSEVQAPEAEQAPAVEVSSEPVAATIDDDQLLVQTLSDNNIATLHELKKLFERVQDLEDENKKLQDILDEKESQIKDLSTQTQKVDDLEITIGELRKKLDAQYLIIQKVRQEADKNMFSKGYTIPEDIMSLVKNTTR
jgi:predicted RNase H-like nuclease (RuvC/YqgF family)